MKHISPLAAIAALGVAAAPAMAQASDWTFAGSVYLFTSKTDTSIGDLEGELSFSDALSNLDVAFMGAFEARNGKWSFIADYMLTDLSFGNDTPGPQYSGLNTAIRTQILSGYAAYQVHDTATVSFDLLGGFRWFKTQSDLTLLPGTAPGQTASVDNDWVDPVIGFRTRFEISPKWSGTVFADYGGSGSDRETWQVLLTADYEINESWLARVGYRQISVENNEGTTDFGFEQSGPIFGVTYRF